MKRTKWQLMLMVVVLMMASIIHVWAAPPQSVKKPTLTVKSNALVYDGTSQEGITVTHNDPNTSAYVISGIEATNAGTHIAKATLQQPGYVWEGGSGTDIDDVTQEWSIAPAPLPDLKPIADQFWTGNALKPFNGFNVGAGGVTPGNDDFTLAYTDNVKPDDSPVTVTAKPANNNFTGESSTTFNILRKPVARPTVTATDRIYNGSEQIGVTIEGGVAGSYTISGTLKATNANPPGEQYTATVTLNDYYAWDSGDPAEVLTEPWTIASAPLPALNTIDDQFWTGSALKPFNGFNVGADGVTPGKDDYTLAYTDNVKPDDSPVTVTAKPANNNFTGESSTTFNILRQPVARPTVTATDHIYNGSEQIGVTIEGGVAGSYATSGTLKATDANPPGEPYTATVTLNDYYEWENEQGNTALAPITKTWNIAKANIPIPNAIDDQTYNLGNAVKPAVSFPASPPVASTDYALSYNDNTGVTDKAKVTVTATVGSKNYQGSAEQTFKIVPIKVDRPVAITPSPEYTGKELQGVKEGAGYKLTGHTGTEVGEYEATAKLDYGYVWATGDPEADVKITWHIVAQNLPDIAPLDDVPFNGTAHEPGVEMKNPVTNADLVKDTDYTLAYENNTNAGQATVTVTGIGNYAGDVVKVHFNITPIALPQPEAVADQVYTSEAITPAPVLKDDATGTLEAGRDYTVAYSDNTAVGKALITVTGKGNYQAESVVTVGFNIVPAALTEIAEIKPLAFTGEALTPPVTMVYGKDNPLVADRDYTLAYENNVHAGTATVTATGRGNYTGVQKREFRIVPIVLPAIADLDAVPFIGQAYEPDVTMVNPVTEQPLVKDTDYTLAYEDNINAGTATITVRGINDYAGSIKTHPFTITPIPLPDIEAIEVQAYTAAVIEPPIVMADDFTDGPLVKDRDFTVAYRNNTDGAMIKSAVAAKPIATVTGINNYAGDTKTIEFVIEDQKAPVFNREGAKDRGATLLITVEDDWGLAGVKVLLNGTPIIEENFAGIQQRTYEYEYDITYQLPGNYQVFATDLYGYTVNLFNESGKEEETETAYQYFADSDKDGLSDSYELMIGTDPKNADSDGDGLTDGDEVLRHRTNPLSQDTDGDGLSDTEEQLILAARGFSPLAYDSDKDGISDTVAASVMDLYPVWEYNSTLAAELLLRPNRAGLKPAMDAPQVSQALEDMVTYNVLAGLTNPYTADVDKGRVKFSPVSGEGRDIRTNIGSTETLMVSLNPQGKQLGIYRQMLVVYDKNESGATVPAQVLDLERLLNADGTPALTYGEEAKKGKDALVVMADANGMLLLAGSWNAAEQKTTADLILIDVAKLQAYRIPGSTGATRFDVAPDASKAAYMLGGKVYVIDLASTNIKVLENKATLLDFTDKGELIINLSGSKATLVDLEGNETSVDFAGVVNVSQPTNNYRNVILVKDGAQIAFSFAASVNIRTTGQVWMRAQIAAPNVEAAVPAFNAERLHDMQEGRGLKINRMQLKDLIP
ncbi:MAG: hypothetical protein ACOX63_00715 [Christensenellales bacterium]|jgi:hypothetical protein